MTARVDRAFMHRATRRPPEQGVRRFVDIGTGIPTEPDPHHATADFAPEEPAAAVEKPKLAGVALAPRSREEFARFFTAPNCSAPASRSSRRGTQVWANRSARTWANRSRTRTTACFRGTARWPTGRRPAPHLPRAVRAYPGGSTPHSPSRAAP